MGIRAHRAYLSLAFFVISFLSSPLSAQQVREVTLVQLQKLVTDTLDEKPLVVHYTSNDGL